MAYKVVKGLPTGTGEQPPAPSASNYTLGSMWYDKGNILYDQPTPGEESGGGGGDQSGGGATQPINNGLTPPSDPILTGLDQANGGGGGGLAAPPAKPNDTGPMMAGLDQAMMGDQMGGGVAPPGQGPFRPNLGQRNPAQSPLVLSRRAY